MAEASTELVAHWGQGPAADRADVVAWLLELEHFADRDHDIKVHLVREHIRGPRLYTPLERDGTHPQVKRAALKLLGTVGRDSSEMARFTAGGDGNRLLRLMMSELLGPSLPSVQATASVGLAKLLGGAGDAATLNTFQSLFLEAAASQEPDQALVVDMQAELAAAQPLPGHVRRWTITGTALQAINYMLASDDTNVQLATLILVRDVVRVPDSGGSPQGTAMAAQNRELIRGSGIPAAMARVIASDLDTRPEPVFCAATVCLDAIAVLMTGEGDAGAMTAAAFHEAGLAAMLVHLMGTSYLAREPEILMRALVYNLGTLIRHSPEARAAIQPDAAALARIADTIHVPALADAMDDLEVIADIREALELIMALLAKQDPILDRYMVQAGILGNTADIAHGDAMPAMLRLLAYDVCEAMQPASAALLAENLAAQQQPIPAVAAIPHDGEGGGGNGGANRGQAMARLGRKPSIRCVLVAGLGVLVFKGSRFLLRNLFRHTHRKAL